MNETTDWGSAIAILSAGLIVGGMFIYFFVRRRTVAPPVDLELRDLEAKRDALVEQLRAEVSGEERTRLEVETAQVLRAIDEKKKARPRTAAAEPAAPATPVSPRKAAMIGFAWGAGSVLVLGGLGYFVMNSLQPREDAAQQQAMQTPQGDPIVAQLEASVRQSPENLGARISLAQAYLERDNLMGVFEQTQYVLSKNPHDSRALTYQALVRMAMGQRDEAVEMLEQATKNDPALLDAWVSLAWAHVQSGKVKEADAAMQQAIRNRPDEKQRLEQVLAQMKAHQDVDMTPPQPADSKGVRITIELDPAARVKNGVIYVMARPAGVSSGPPIAVKRLSANSLPVTFDLSSADSMMGQPLPAKMRIEARLDSDGDAATKSPDDPVAAQDSVVAGSTLKLALK